MTHRQVRIIPLPKHSQSLEVALMLLHVTRREFPAKPAKFRRRNFSFSAQFLFHLRLDRQPMAIPSRHVRRVMPSHALGFDDHVFQNLIQSGAQMNRSRRIRRPVMQHKKRLALARCKNALVQMRFLPGRKLLRLVLRKAGFHRKISSWQV